MKLLHRIVISLAGGVLFGAFFAFFMPQGTFGASFLTSGMVMSICLMGLLSAWDGLGGGRMLAWATGLAFFLRLALGLFLLLALPIWGYPDSPTQQAGYVFYDAFRRDTQAWELAASGDSLLGSFSREFYTDQYGGLLALSAGVYRIFSPDVHRSHLILILAAFAGALGVPYFWKALRVRFGPGIAALGTWIFALYPEAVLLGSSQMREPFLIALAAIAFYALIQWPGAAPRPRKSVPAASAPPPEEAEPVKQDWTVRFTRFLREEVRPGEVISRLGRLRPKWLWRFGPPIPAQNPIEIPRPPVIEQPPAPPVPTRAGYLAVFLVALLGMALFSSRAAAAAAGLLAVWFWLENLYPDWTHRRQRLGWLFLGLGGTAAAVLGWEWLRSSAGLDLFWTVYNSGYMARIITYLPKILHIPFLILYGLAQPVLPAALAETAIPLWKGLVIFRSLGWYALAPFWAFALVAVWKALPPADRRVLGWTAVFTLAWVLLSSARAGGDPWDNPRYRTMFLPWLALLAAWLVHWVRQKRGAWLGWLARLLLAEGVFLLVFLHWYLSRYLNHWKKLSFWPTLGLAVALIGLALGLGWLWEKFSGRRKNKVK